MSYSVHSTKLARFTAMEKQHLQFVQEIAAEEHWDVLLEDLELVYTEYGEFMIVALNEQDQVLGKLHIQQWLKFLFSIIIVQIIRHVHTENGQFMTVAVNKQQWLNFFCFQL